MDTKQPLTLFIVAILAASVFSVVGITSIPLQNASAQAITVETSADELGGTFFGHGALQVIIDDENTDDDASDEIDVTIDVEGVSDTFTIPDTSDGSQRFEFFLLHADSSIGGDLDGIAAAPTLITFGTGGDLDTGDDLFVDATIDIGYENEDVTIQYEEDNALLTLDKEAPYGSISTIHVMITDQDGNINPTETDEFDLTVADLADLFDIQGGNFTEDVTFEETGTNNAEFEGEVSLNAGSTLPFFDATEETVQLTVNDQAQYNTTLLDSAGGAIAIEDGGINDSTDTSDVTFEIDDADGEVDDITTVTFGSELKATIRDDDQNTDSDEDDDIAHDEDDDGTPDEAAAFEGGLVVEVDGGVGSDFENVDLTETDENTGVFAVDASNDELKITFLNDTFAGADLEALGMWNNSILELRPGDIDEDFIVSYLDPLDDGSSQDEVVEFTISLTNTPTQSSAPDEVGVTDEFTVTTTDPDLNDNSRTRDSYTFVMDGLGPWPLERGGEVFGDLYTFDLELDGEGLDFTTPVSTTLTETGVNTGIFEIDIDVQDITDFAEIDGDPVQVSDGDDISFNIDDCFDDPTDCDEADVTITIGKPTVDIDFSRTAVPIPPEAGSLTEAAVGSDVVIQLILTDPSLATQSNVEEVVAFDIGTDTGNFTITIDGDEVNNITVDEQGGVAGPAGTYEGDTDGCDGGGTDDEAEIVDGVSLCEVLAIDSLDETGKATGVFEAEITLTGSPDADDMPSDSWQDAEFSFTYLDDEGDEQEAGFTMRGNDGILTTDQPSAKVGTIMTVTVEDQDLNLDDGETESFDSTDTVAPGMLLIETEDEQIEDIAGCPSISSETFEETEDDSGIFTATWEVGDDIPVSCLDDDVVESASNILITYDDEIDSTGGSGDEIELSVPLATATGSIQVSPELVGPATTITVLITDTDLDEDSASTDEYLTTDPTGDDFFVTFSSSRNEVGEGSPDIEETGPNTGVFMFEIELITDETACQDDDLDGDEFNADGGDTEVTIGACPGDLVSVSYEDEHTGGGGSATVSEVVEVGSWDPEFVADKESYNIGDRVTVTISDPDANRDSDIADSLTDLRVISDSDRVGEEFSAIETGRDTGVFRLSFGTSSGAQSGSISVKTGDDITVRYTDEFPADFEEQEEDKDFLFTIPIGAPPGGETTVSAPEPQDVTGKKLTQINVDQQIVLTTNVFNKGTNPQPFVALMEIRDSNDVTVYLAWQTGTLNPSGTAQVGLSWTPTQADNYEARTFVISSLNNPSILSTVSTSNIAVS